jgi:hypothetical protein
MDSPEADYKTHMVLSIIQGRTFLFSDEMLFISANKSGLFISGARKSLIFMRKLSSTHLMLQNGQIFKNIP